MNQAMFVFLLLLIISCNTNRSDQHEINEDVWKPLFKSLNDDDTVQCASLYSSIIQRTERRDLIHIKDARYLQRTLSNVKTDISSNIKFDSDIRFWTREALKGRAYETGYCKCTFTFPNGEETISYYMFQVTMAKEDGQWNILSDSVLPVVLTEEEFLKGSPME